MASTLSGGRPILAFSPFTTIGRSNRAEFSLMAFNKSSFVNAGLSGFDGCTEWLKWDNRILEMLEATREN